MNDVTFSSFPYYRIETGNEIRTIENSYRNKEDEI